jgi:hypothetical protein
VGRRQFIRGLTTVGRPHMVHIVRDRGYPQRIRPPGPIPTRVARGPDGAQRERADECAATDHTMRMLPTRADPIRDSTRERPRAPPPTPPFSRSLAPPTDRPPLTRPVHQTGAIVTPQVPNGVKLVATGKRAAADTHQGQDDRMRDGSGVVHGQVSYVGTTQPPRLTRLHRKHRHSAHRTVGKVRRVDASGLPRHRRRRPILPHALVPLSKEAVGRPPHHTERPTGRRRKRRRWRRRQGRCRRRRRRRAGRRRGKGGKAAGGRGSNDHRPSLPCGC